MEQTLSVIGVNPTKTLIYAYLILLPRFIAAFSFLTFISTGIVQGKTIRNAIIMCMALILLPLTQEQLPSLSFQGIEIIILFIKEIFIGLVIGVVFGFPMFAVQAFGFLIDNQRGATVDTVINPGSESETTVLGNFFDLFFSAFFFTAGLIYLYLNFFYSSFVIWPIQSFLPTINSDFTTHLLKQLDLIFEFAVLLAGPIVLIMFLSEISLAFINKFSPQLNVFIMAMSVKSGVAFFVLTFYFPVIQYFLADEIVNIDRISTVITLLLT
jgi:type III secretion protein T